MSQFELDIYQQKNIVVEALAQHASSPGCPGWDELYGSSFQSQSSLNCGVIQYDITN